MKKRLKAWLPSPDNIRNNRWLRWMGPTLHHPRLWHFSRKGIAMGLALGIFFGLLVPVAQMPLSAAAAIILRANLPMAVASTLVTNPVTFGPLYYGAYRVGKVVLGEPQLTEAQASALLERAMKTQQAEGWNDRLDGAMRRLSTVGKPLVVGLAIVATLSGLAVYFIISAIWILRVRWSRSRRLKARVTRLNPSTDQP
ncbi:MAG: DUF2062 domain-containing protein [Hydrogenophaga sp.]|jgi:uncharacterized protein (DUF2062 family)|uniref:DUF2062 domain-containing protein n=1 Tax=Hydrogenophaga sp. TaxID=1904254 RepID=UPI002731E079|nr:DUF2062 domain-containing protein [Hydrogenophaga sp.]MDP2406963.1 DUF2062 domain-containing protein [Hydrogenophaga sp.]MDZ4176142.1 DUF2062 domain-containing protein [Hydrogenophaga sp.]